MQGLAVLDPIACAMSKTAQLFHAYTCAFDVLNNPKELLFSRIRTIVFKKVLLEAREIKAYAFAPDKRPHPWMITLLIKLLNKRTYRQFPVGLRVADDSPNRN